MPRPMRESEVPWVKALQGWWISEGKKRFGALKQLAEALGVTVSTLSRYMSGDRFPNPAQRQRLYEATSLECFRETVITKHHPLEGTSKGSKAAPHAAELNAWLLSQRQYSSKRQLATVMGFTPSKLLNYFASRQFPDPKERSRLYEVTKLDCFGPGAESALALHRRLLKVQKPWVRDLLTEIHRFIHHIYPRTHQRRRFYGYESKIIKEIERSEITQISEIDHRKLIRFELEKRTRDASDGRLASLVVFLKKRDIGRPIRRRSSMTC